MNSGYNESINFDLENNMDPIGENMPKKIITGLKKLNDNETFFLINLVDTGFKEFVIESDESILKNKTFEHILSRLNKEKVLSTIKSLEEKQYLIKENLEPEILCPDCLSNRVKIIFSCSECGSKNLSKYETIEHSYCGYTDDKSLFNKEEYLICPKCKSDLTRINVNINKSDQSNSEYYTIKDVTYKCNECENEIYQPSIDLKCVDCGSLYNYVNVIYNTFVKYTIPETVFDKIMSRNKVNLLIVEDFSPQADVVAMLLSSASNNIEYNIAIAGNGTSAKLALSENEFNIVLLDLGLPDINGLDLLSEIKSKWPDIQVIVLTGYDDTEIAVDAMKKGAAEFLIKKNDTIQNLPNMMEKLVERIKKE